MSHTHRRHDPPVVRAKRGPKRQAELSRKNLKTPKQRRVNDRAALRKEW